MRGSKAILSMLEMHGVSTIFGYPGANNTPLYDDLLGSSIHHVLVRHEQGAAHMADGYARATGNLGVCLTTSGPGATNLTTGIATAYADSSPVMALTGQVSTGFLGSAAFQEADMFDLMMPIVKHAFRVLDTGDIPEAMARGIGIATSGRFGPVLIDLPKNVQDGELAADAMARKIAPPAVTVDMSAMPEAVKVIAASQRPLLLAGGGAAWSGAGPDLARLAELLGAPVVTTLMGKGCFPEDHPLSLGMVGMHGRQAAMQALRECDLLIAIGTRFSDRSTTLSELRSDAAIVEVNIDPPVDRGAGRREVVLRGDARQTLQAMVRRITRRLDSAWTRRAADLGLRCRCAGGRTNALTPQAVMRSLNALLPRDAVVTTDVGQNQMWAAHFLASRHPRHFITSGGFGTMGFGLPAAIGAKCAQRSSSVACIAGDGGFQMTCMELATAIAEDLPVAVIVLDNGGLGMVRQWQDLFMDGRRSSVSLGGPDLVELAEAYGAEGARVERISELDEAIARAIGADRPFIVDVAVDQDEKAYPMLVPSDSGSTVIPGECSWEAPDGDHLLGPSRPVPEGRYAEGER